ncbi:MAG: ribosome biogenesis factor YjgA [Rhodocyclaceae bacterium]
MSRFISPEPIEAPDRPSKSQRKRDMHELQDLGEKLAQMSRDRLAKVDLPEGLRRAIEDVQRITKHEARRRQMQYIGKLMRDVDPEPLREAIDVLEGRSAAETARLHRVERLRDRLLEDEAVLTEIGRDHPGADLQKLAQLRRNALKEQEQARPPRAFRELFRALRDLGGSGAAPNLADDFAEEGQASN